MKERIVVKDEIFADFLIKNKDNHSISASPKVIMDRCRVEQVPETLGQVAFLLRQKLQENNRDWYIETHIDRHEQEFRFMGILFSSNNTLSIKINGADVVVMANISYPLMWAIIKNLIGE